MWPPPSTLETQSTPQTTNPNLSNYLQLGFWQLSCRTGHGRIFHGGTPPARAEVGKFATLWLLRGLYALTDTDTKAIAEQHLLDDS
jgi:hypothetical protein